MTFDPLRCEVFPSAFRPAPKPRIIWLRLDSSMCNEMDTPKLFENYVLESDLHRF